MQNKEPAKKKTEEEPKPKQPNVSAKLSKFNQKLFGVIKFALGASLLPFVYSSSVSFFNEIALIDKSSRVSFWSGAISLILVYLFVWEPAIIYNKGHQLLEVVFNFFKPLVKVAPYLVPIYTIVIFIAYGISSFWVRSPQLIQYTLFLAGFTIALHLVFSAKTVRSKKDDFLKANYIFGFSFIYIVNLLILGMAFSLIFKEFSFINFFNSSSSLAKDIFTAVFKQLFLR